MERECPGESCPRARSLGELKDMCRQLLSAITVAHSLGYAHCAIKPANVAVRRDSEGGGVLMSILGWEAAEKLSPSDEHIGGNGRGTAEFTAPEMAARRMCTPAVDIYSLGLTFKYFAENLRCKVARYNLHLRAFDRMVEDMTVDEPDARPSAAQLLE